MIQLDLILDTHNGLLRGSIMRTGECKVFEPFFAENSLVPPIFFPKYFRDFTDDCVGEYGCKSVPIARIKMTHPPMLFKFFLCFEFDTALARPAIRIVFLHRLTSSLPRFFS